jgi:DNA-binding transcriptional ArsR family regulator
MPVTRLRTRRDAGDRTTLEAVRGMLEAVAGAEDVVALVERKLSAARGWGFVMVDPVAYAEVIAHLRRHSRRPLVAMELFTRLFSYLPPDGNEVLCSREELARVVGSDASHVSKIMGELEAIGAVYRRREGRGVRYFVNPLLGTHLAGAARDRAQAEAPTLRLVELASSDRR